MSDYARLHDLAPPCIGIRGVSLNGVFNRLESARWWRRNMRKQYSRQAEETLRELGFVNARHGLYVSREALRFRLSQRQRNLRLLNQAEATNDRGESFTLRELSARNTSNPVIRRAELMTRISGTEQYAKQHGHSALLVVVTLPSRFHCSHSNSPSHNPTFDGSSAREGNAWLNKQWQRLRARLQRKKIEFYGLRTTEPHHDGTPHWNVLLFSSTNDLVHVRAAFTHYFLDAESPNEPGATTHRVKYVDINASKGGATAYIAKYISKNIDGFGVGADHEDSERQRDTADTCARVDAWASIHGIRQFQQFGAPPVTIWRELRRLRHGSRDVIESGRLAADQGSWSNYADVMALPSPANASWPISLFRVWSDKTGYFGDPVGLIVQGVCSGDHVEITRDTLWDVKWNSPSEPSMTLH